MKALRTLGTVLTTVSTLTAAGAAQAADAVMDKGDVAWMLVATTLVLFMTIPGIALFYGGMARTSAAPLRSCG